MCDVSLSETGEQHTLLLAREQDESMRARAAQAPRGSETIDACWCLRARLRASVRACVQRPEEFVVSAPHLRHVGEEASSHGRRRAWLADM